MESLERDDEARIRLFRERVEARQAEAGAQGETRKDRGVELVAHVLTTGCWPSVSAKQGVRILLLPSFPYCLPQP